MRLDDHLLLRQQLHLKSAPAWMSQVLATGVGLKIAGGRATDEPALHLIIDDKLPLQVLSQAQRIPATIDGLTIDLLRARGEFSLDELGAGAEVETPVVKSAWGAPVIAGREVGTIACAGRRADGKAVLITCAHVARASDDAYLFVDERPPLGACNRSVEITTAERVYPDLPELKGTRIGTDAASIVLDSPIVFRGGLPGGAPFQIGASAAVAAWLRSTKDVLARTYGTATGARQGKVATVWPRLNGEKHVGFCAIQQNKDSLPSDSGGLWIGLRGPKDLVALGLHRGMPDEWPSGMAYVTDLRAGMTVLGVTNILSDPAETTSVSANENVLSALWLHDFAKRLRL